MEYPLLISKLGIQNKSKDKTYTNVVSETLLKLAKKDKKVTADYCCYALRDGFR